MKIGIIGCGHMGKSVARRLSLQNLVFLNGHHPVLDEQFANEIKGTYCQEVLDLIKQVDVVILAVKPKDLLSVSNQLRGSLAANQIVVSLLAGVTLSTLSKTFGEMAIVRLMPNLAVQFGDGVVGLSAEETLDSALKNRITELFLPLGLVKWIPEAMMDSITALTGSGPAFALVMIEAMVDAAVAMGFSAEEGKRLVLQMLKGTIIMLQETNKHPGAIKWEIASPGGTTIAGLNVLESLGVRHATVQAFLAAKTRASELG